jgi:hypothetical protein
MKIKKGKHGTGYLGELEYISTFIKGKKGKGVLDYRILVKNTKTGEESIIFIADSWMGYEIILIETFKYINEKHIKFKNYNYYYLNSDENTVHEIFKAWKDSNPSIYIGGYIHQQLSSYIKEGGVYTYSHKIDDIKY